MKLPAQITVLERGWLSANNILLRGRSGPVLVDSGYVAHAPQTVALIERVLGETPLARLVNTHCHSDHMGGNAAVKRRYGCPISLPVGEAPLIEAWDEEALILSYADQRAERFAFDHTFAPGEVLEMGDIEWQVIAAPGHDTHATMFYSPTERVLVSGDALWENGFGVIFPQMLGRTTAFAETRHTLDTIAALDVDVVIPGHGAPFTGVDAALERAYSRLHAFEEDPARLPRHTAKVMLTFALLERRRMLLAELPAYVERVPILADINHRYLAMAPADYADWLVRELERARAVRRAEGYIEPLVAA